MEISPDEFLAKKVEWQFFATLTFKGKLPGDSARHRMLFAWVRWWEDLQRTLGGAPGPGKRSPVLWMVREELGEITGRFHYHLLLGGLSKRLVQTRTAMASCAQWEKLGGGMARNYVYSPTLQGVQYVLKGLAEIPDSETLRKHGALSYEMGKFNGDEGRRVLLGHSLCWRLLTRQANKRLCKARAMRAYRRGN